MSYTTKKFNLPTLKGLSEKQIKIHLGLYEGYVKHVNLISEKLQAVRDGKIELDPYIATELRRRFSFEFDGMRMHEYYFSQFEHSSHLSEETDGHLKSGITRLATEKYGSHENFIAHIKEVAKSRGIGWVVVYYDSSNETLHTIFVNDHELGQLAGLPILLALDLWEHAFMIDFLPSEKGNYVDVFFDNINWGVVGDRLQATNQTSPA